MTWHSGRREADGTTEPFLLPGSSGQELDSHRVTVGASIGIALAPDHGGERAALLRHADVAMYTAKSAGGGYSFYAAAQDGHSPRRLALTGALRRALTNDELHLYYQPAMDVQSGRVAWVEALARWQHPEHGLLPPDTFIPLAEQMGLINALTRWVLETAVRDSGSWARSELAMGVAVNLSAHNLLDAELPHAIAALLERYDELTESAIMTDPVQATEALSRIAALGCDAAQGFYMSRPLAPADLTRWLRER